MSKENKVNLITRKYRGKAKKEGRKMAENDKNHFM